LGCDINPRDGRCGFHQTCSSAALKRRKMPLKKQSTLIK
jgi:hypothetical protein